MKAEAKCLFDGATGDCSMCGTSVTLEWGDRPFCRHQGNDYDDSFKVVATFNVWNIECPICGSTIECSIPR